MSDEQAASQCLEIAGGLRAAIKLNFATAIALHKADRHSWSFGGCMHGLCVVAREFGAFWTARLADHELEAIVDLLRDESERLRAAHPCRVCNGTGGWSERDDDVPCEVCRGTGRDLSAPNHGPLAQEEEHRAFTPEDASSRLGTVHQQAERESGATR